MSELPPEYLGKFVVLNWRFCCVEEQKVEEVDSLQGQAGLSLHHVILSCPVAGNMS